MANEQAIESAIRAYFQSHAWDFTLDEVNHVFHSELELESAFKKADLLLAVNAKGYLIYTRVFLTLSETEIPTLLAKMNSINCSLTYGHFELGENGSLRYRMAVICEDVPTNAQLHSALHIPTCVMNYYGDDLLSVLVHTNSLDTVCESCTKERDE